MHAERAAGTDATTRQPPDRRRVVKHALDRVVAAFGLVVTAPIVLLVALALRLRGGPVLERRRRVGEGGRAIELLSFAITDEMCRGRAWRLAANLGLAVLPQLWNVMRGELSIVGPRPRPEAWPAPPARPGLTGLAQLRQLEGTLTLADEAALDDEYARTWSPALDARIVGRTLWSVLR